MSQGNDPLWTVSFLVRDIPEEFACRGKNWAMLGCPPKLLDQLKEIAEREKHWPTFFTEKSDANFVLISFRLNAGDDQIAFRKGKARLEAVLDAYAIHAERNHPKVGGYCLTAKDGDADIRIALVGSDSWVFFHGKDDAIRQSWAETRVKAFKKFFPFVDLAVAEANVAETALTRQLIRAMRIYRFGTESGRSSGAFGVEFLCKWTALEGLVCSRNDPKGSTLRARIPLLFPASERPAIQ